MDLDSGISAMDPFVDCNTAKAFATALRIGALIGIEREQHKVEEVHG